MLKTTTLTLALAASVLTAGCLRSETTHVLYVSPDGGVTWTTTEADVHSDEKDPAARMAEEREYLSAVQAGMPLPSGAGEYGVRVTAYHEPDEQYRLQIWPSGRHRTNGAAGGRKRRRR